jgi:hypothetical protein
MNLSGKRKDLTSECYGNRIVYKAMCVYVHMFVYLQNIKTES